MQTPTSDNEKGEVVIRSVPLTSDSVRLVRVDRNFGAVGKGEIHGRSMAVREGYMLSVIGKSGGRATLPDCILF